MNTIYAVSCDFSTIFTSSMTAVPKFIELHWRTSQENPTIFHRQQSRKGHWRRLAFTWQSSYSISNPKNRIVEINWYEELSAVKDTACQNALIHVHICQPKQYDVWMKYGSIFAFQLYRILSPCIELAFSNYSTQRFLSMIGTLRFLDNSINSK